MQVCEAEMGQVDYEAMANALLEQGKAVANEHGGARTALDDPDNPMLAIAAAAPPTDVDDDNAEENLVCDWDPLEARRLFWKYLRREEHRKRKFEAWQAEEERRAREWAATQAATADAARRQAEAAAAADRNARLSAQAAMAAAGSVAAAPAAAAAAAAPAAPAPPLAPPVAFTAAEDRELCVAAASALRSGDATLTKAKPWEALAEAAAAAAGTVKAREASAAQQRAALLLGCCGGEGGSRGDVFVAGLSARIAARLSSDKTATALAASAADTLYPRRFGATPAGVRAGLSAAVSAVLEQAAAQPDMTTATASRQMLRAVTPDAFDAVLRCVDARIAGQPPPVVHRSPAPDAAMTGTGTVPDAAPPQHAANLALPAEPPLAAPLATGGTAHVDLVQAHSAGARRPRGSVGGAPDVAASPQLHSGFGVYPAANAVGAPLGLANACACSN